MKLKVLASSLKPYGFDLSGIEENEVVERKQFLPTLKVMDGEESTVICSMTTQDVDADGDMIMSSGCDLSRFKNNPVVVWSHDYSKPPIGKATEIAVTPKSVDGKIKFAPTPFAQEIFELVKGGFLRTCSIGFITKGALVAGSKACKDYCKEMMIDMPANCKRIVTKWTLLENSMVCIPANPEALVQAVSAKSIKLDEKLQKELGIEKVETIEDKTIKPLGPFADFAACVLHMMKTEGHSKESATKICGKMEADSNKDAISNPSSTESQPTSISKPANPNEAVQLAINDAVNLLTASGYSVALIPEARGPVGDTTNPAPMIAVSAVPNPLPSGSSNGDNGMAAKEEPNTPVTPVNISTDSSAITPIEPAKPEESVEDVDEPTFTVICNGPVQMTVALQKSLMDQVKAELEAVKKGKIL